MIRYVLSRGAGTWKMGWTGQRLRAEDQLGDCCKKLSGDTKGLEAGCLGLRAHLFALAFSERAA